MTVDEKQRVKNGERKFNSAIVSSSSVCPGCGAEAQRESAKFCLVCGKSLGKDYEPLDRLRASYRLRDEKNYAQTREKIVARKTEETPNLFEQNKNQISQTAWASLVYSFVPYLGILFIPFTVFIGGFGYVAAVRQPQIGGRKLALVSVGLSFVVFAVQIFLWWLLYIIPEIGRQI